jgi:hypothetical protein
LAHSSKERAAEQLNRPHFKEFAIHGKSLSCKFKVVPTARVTEALEIRSLDSYFEILAFRTDLETPRQVLKEGPSRSIPVSRVWHSFYQAQKAVQGIVFWQSHGHEP